MAARTAAPAGARFAILCTRESICPRQRSKKWYTAVTAISNRWKLKDIPLPEFRIVAPNVAGSIPVSHPTNPRYSREGIKLACAAFRRLVQAVQVQERYKP